MLKSPYIELQVQSSTFSLQILTLQSKWWRWLKNQT